MSVGRALSTYAEIVDVLNVLPMIVREARRQHRLSLRQMAAEVGCSFSTIARIEDGNDGRVENAILILQWLDKQ